MVVKGPGICIETKLTKSKNENKWKDLGRKEKDKKKKELCLYIVLKVDFNSALN
jgi:hypothetical protein